MTGDGRVEERKSGEVGGGERKKEWRRGEEWEKKRRNRR